MMLLISLSLLCCALGAGASIFAWHVARSGSVGYLRDRFNTLLQLSELHSDQIGTLQQQHNVLRSRLNMRELREKRRSEASTTQDSAPSVTDEDAKAAVRRELSAKLANGSIKLPGR
jgi:hypothetical protein